MVKYHYNCRIWSCGTAARQRAKSIMELEITKEPPLENTLPWPNYPNKKKTDYGVLEANELMGHDIRLYETTIDELVVEDNMAGDSLAGKTFVITGSVEHFANRNELKEYIESLGGKVTGSVTKNTSYLINNDITSSSSKNKTAAKLNVPVITENDFLELAGNKDLM